MKIEVGKVYLTNVSKPGGLVRVLEIKTSDFDERLAYRVEYIEDHPYGYAQGTIGYYLEGDLVPAPEEKAG